MTCLLGPEPRDHLGSWYRPAGALTSSDVGHQFADLLLKG